MKNSRFRQMLRPALTAVLVAAFPACGGSGIPAAPGPQLSATPSNASRPSSLPAPRSARAGLARTGARRRTVGLGPIVQSAFGGEIYGWDIDQNGSDGLLSETVTENSGPVFLNGIETFDESSGKITKIVQKTRTDADGPTPVVDAIAGNDVGLIDDQFDFVRSGKLVRDDRYLAMNPVSGNKITGRWKPPHPLDLEPNFVSNNQASSSQIVTAYENKRDDDKVALYTYDTVRNAWGKRLDFPQRFLFGTDSPIYAAVDVATNEAVVGYLKRSRYNPRESPTFYVMDAATGKHLRSFYGLGYGFPNGMAIDPTTDIMCTTTFNDMDVEFYKLSIGKGKAVQIPVYFGGGPLTQGAAVAADPIHHLFLVAQLNSTFSSNGGSTVIVYDEHGKLVEYLDGFNFINNYTPVVPHLAVNPSSRTGYVNGPALNQLQEFTY